MKMTKKIISILLSLMLVLGAVSVGGMSASADDEMQLVSDGIAWNETQQRYEISSYAGLKKFADIVNGGNASACAKLMNDIDASGYTDWTPIGKDENNTYTGTFDGNGRVIIGLSNSGVPDAPNYAGLFGNVGTKTEGGITTKGTVKNVGLEGGSITGGFSVGGVVGFNDTGTVTNCYNTGDVSGSSDVGGVVGCNSRGTVANCYNTGAVSGRDIYVGGVVGYNSRGTVANCYNTGAVSGRDTYVGGVVGSNYNSVTNCYNTGAVSGSSFVGGIAGYFMGGLVTNCYNTGHVSGSGEYVGGITGVSEGINGEKATVTNCFYDSDIVTGVEPIGYAYGDGASHSCVKGLTTAQMTGVASNDDNTMKALFDAVDDNGEKVWLDPKADEEDDGVYYWFYPHLKGFAYDTDSTAENWPAKLVINTSWDNDGPFTCNGLPQNPEPKEILVSNFDGVPDELAECEVRFYGYQNDGWEQIDPPAHPGNYRVGYWLGDEEVLHSYFSIFETGDYSVAYKYREPDNEQWTGVEDCVDAGEYRAMLTFIKYGDKTALKDFVINAAVTDEMVSTDKSSAEYNAQSQSPEVTVKDGEKALTKDTDYTVSYKNADGVTVSEMKNAGTYKVVITGKGDYTGSVEKNFTINPKAVTITAKGASKTYDGSALTQSEFTASALEENDTHTFTVVMTESSTITDFGTQANVIATVDGVNVTAGTATPVGNYSVTTESGNLSITPRSVTVTITGKQNSAPYDGEEHIVSDYIAESSDPLYKCSGETLDFNFTGTAKARRTDAGTTYMGLTDSQFVNKNANFDVTFDVTDGYQKILAPAVTVTVKGNSAEADYDGSEHIASGYTATADNEFYDVENDISFSGTAEAKRTEPGTESMGLDAGQFTNTNTNFDVTFEVEEDGILTVNPVVKFVNEDGSELQSSAVAYGETPQYTGETPLKGDSDGHSYTFSGWSPEITEATENRTYTAVFTTENIDYTATFIADGETVDTKTFTVETETLDEPAVPAKEGYEGKWSEYTIAAGDMEITAQYTPIEYTATFIADGETVAEIPYTVETESIEAPAVPEKEGFTGEWEEYELTPGGITVNAVYTENEPEDLCPLDNEDHGDGFFGRVLTFLHTLIWRAFRFLGLNVFFKVS